ncbi:MAG: hypothetical protein JSV65_13010 [Armatimonadota bacterium]|nr:MAG: hypothetical protein JSV65_13010 [Armatimonadota bacterium]
MWCGVALCGAFVANAADFATWVLVPKSGVMSPGYFSFIFWAPMLVIGCALGFWAGGAAPRGALERGAMLGALFIIFEIADVVWLGMNEGYLSLGQGYCPFVAGGLAAVGGGALAKRFTRTGWLHRGTTIGLIGLVTPATLVAIGYYVYWAFL